MFKRQLTTTSALALAELVSNIFTGRFSDILIRKDHIRGQCAVFALVHRCAKSHSSKHSQRSDVALMYHKDLSHLPRLSILRAARGIRKSPSVSSTDWIDSIDMSVSEFAYLYVLSILSKKGRAHRGKR